MHVILKQSHDCWSILFSYEIEFERTDLKAIESRVYAMTRDQIDCIVSLVKWQISGLEKWKIISH
jgi:hypothetical protein